MLIDVLRIFRCPECLPKMRQSRAKGIIISIGITDIYNDTRLYEMRRMLSLLYELCVAEGLYPWFTTIGCIGSPVLVEKAEIVNEFIRTHFTNVIDINDVAAFGLETTLLSYYSR